MSPRGQVLCGSKMLRGRPVEAGMCKISKIEGLSGPRKDAEGFAEGVRGRVFYVIRI